LFIFLVTVFTLRMMRRQETGDVGFEEVLLEHGGEMDA
jgi:hypothetical protein